MYMLRIALFASGSGSNVENIVSYFKDSSTVQVAKVYTNNPNAGVIQRCKRLNVNTRIFTRDEFHMDDLLLNEIKKLADAIILAGFLWQLPPSYISAYPNKIINIHPALLPKFGGKGMYGMNVHRAVKENQETVSGITIHYVNENYDEGAIIFQAETEISPSDTPETIAHKIHKLEYDHFPRIIEKTLLSHG